MRVLVAYASKYGCTRKAVELLAALMQNEYDTNVDLMDITDFQANNEIPRIDGYNLYVVGGPIYGGNIQAGVKKFYSFFREQLLDQPLGLFICCGMVDKYKEQLVDAFPDKLLDHAVVKSYFGYEFNFDRMNFLARMLVRALTGVRESKSEIKNDNIEDFAAKLAGAGSW